ncbi:MAG: poly-beta-1,6-N-acetyl-D-glucosamine N-deacetylase PgaB, partial [Candidatus Aminicenantes bacterium]|nr:poly-beta-1,6-N-acetyl-D-glucosamine N-deacetylase PgaB [Candidatus Aminicenantes bacterium]
MPKRLIIRLATFFFLFYSTSFAMAMDIKPGDFLVLCYHAIPAKARPGDKYSIPQHIFIEHMEYLRTHGYQPVSLDDILEASAGRKTLPKNPVLLTFDDAYISYYEFVVPMLEKFGYPSVLAVVSTFIGNPPKDFPEELMSWNQIREVASKKLVRVVSHSYDLHKGIQYNPQGNIGPSVGIRRYDPDTKKYETEDEYRARLKADFKSQAEIFEKELGFTPKAIVWPFGQHNSISREVAQKEGYRFGFSLEWGVGNINNLHAIKRILMENEPMEDSIENITKPGRDESVMQMHAVQVDLDLIYDPTSYEKTDENLGKLINRLVEMKVNTVFLQAFSDPEGTGNIKSVYFYNSVLPVRGDIFSHAVHQMVIRNMNVYAWLPTLSIVLPDEKLNEELRVREIVEGGTRASQSWYQRLTPFSSDVRELVRRLYEELAAHSQINGIL